MRLICLVLVTTFGPAATGQEIDNPYPYEVHLPAGYQADAIDGFPLILFLHGGGGLIPADHPIPGFAAGRSDFPFVVVTPMTDRPWDVDLLEAVLNEVVASYAIDEARIYAAGLSMGAVGAWELASVHPNRFRALALVAGRPAPEHACSLRHVPVWLFHNRADEIIPADDSLRLAEALESCGARDVRVTIYDDLEPGLWHHNAWKAAFTDPQLYEWLLSH